MAKYKKRADGRYYTTIQTNEINPDTGERVRIPVYGKSITEFEDNKARIRDEINKGIYTNDKGILFFDYKWTWLETYKNNRSYNTQSAYKNILKNHTGALDQLKLSQIKKSDVQLGYNNLKGHPDLQRRYIQTVNQILKAAIDDGYIWKNVADNIETDKAKRKKKRALTKTERLAIPHADFTLREKCFEALLHYAGLRRQEISALTRFDIDLHADFTLREKCFEALLHYAGLRRQEISALTRFDIDLNQRVIHINKAVEWIGEVPHIKDTKSDAGERDIPILEPLFPVLKDYLSELNTTILFPNTSGEYMWIGEIPHIKDTKSDAGERDIPILEPLFPVLKDYLSELNTTILFPNTSGEYMHKTQYRRFFETIKRKINTAAGGKHRWEGTKIIYTVDLCQGLTSHVFRREFATILYYSGIKRKINTAAGGKHRWEGTKIIYTVDLCQGLTSHVFRREFATILYYSGVDMLDAIRMFGHADVQEMLNIYAELRTEESSSADKLNSYLGQKYAKFG